MKNLLQDFVDLLYPVTCPGCNKVLSAGERNLCLSCELDLPIFKNEQVVANILGGRLPVLAGAIYLKFYAGGQTQRLLHQLKYKGNKALGEYLGQQFMNSGNNLERFQHIDLIIPIPLNDKKLQLRGFNQSTIIAQGMANVLDKPVVTTTVSRVTNSESQTRKTRAERWTNVAGIFTCQPDTLQGKHVLLVDDVITTGATMEACAQAILEAGARSISFAVLATAMP